MAPTLGKTPPAGGGGAIAPEGDRLSPKVTERVNVRTFYSEIDCINRKVLSMKSNKRSTLNIKRQLGCVYTADLPQGEPPCGQQRDPHGVGDPQAGEEVGRIHSAKLPLDFER